MAQTKIQTSVIGAVHLTVSDIERSLAFYQDIMGFKIHSREGNIVHLGAGGDDLLVLYGDPDATPLRQGGGLYHYAILVPNRYELAQTLKRFAETRTPLQGLSDHFVSEALYLADPDGNGIEIYADRPRENWEYMDDIVNIGTVYLEPNLLFAELAGRENEAWDGLHPDTVMGHVHLHTADVVAAEKFYRELLGFDLVMRYGPYMTFVSLDGYHHHIGLRNGRRKPDDDHVGLRYYGILLSSKRLEAALERLIAAQIDVQEQDGGYMFRDPSNNGVLLTATA
jgi:catechol 2,3-dioxygenase